MITYRLCHALYRNDLSGKGAEKYGGRWNSKGVAMLYTGETRALCTTEVAVHTPLGILPSNYQLVFIHIPDSTAIYELPEGKLPKRWDGFPHSDATQQLGDAFVKEARYAVMKVPSAIVQGEFNFLINPFHEASRTIKVERTGSFTFDKRLFLK